MRLDGFMNITGGARNISLVFHLAAHLVCRADGFTMGVFHMHPLDYGHRHAVQGAVEEVGKSSPW